MTHLDSNVALDSFGGVLDSLQHLVAFHDLLQEGAGVVLERRQLKISTQSVWRKKVILGLFGLAFPGPGDSATTSGIENTPPSIPG